MSKIQSKVCYERSLQETTRNRQETDKKQTRNRQETVQETDKKQKK